jgi:hypothetical protein
MVGTVGIEPYDHMHPMHVSYHWTTSRNFITPHLINEAS